MAGDPGGEALSQSVLEQAADLARQGDAFVLATVVWRREPSSGRPGAKALVLPDGTVRGWLGGACAEPTVVRESLDALETGEPRLLFLGQAEDGVPPGVTSVPMGCASEGALEVYLEPVLPTPQVVVVGRSPAVDTLASLVRVLGWTVSIVDDGGAGTGRPVGVRVATSLDGFAADGNTAVVVATQGHYDEQALEAALGTDAAYVGLVASRKRADTVRALLRDRGVPEEALTRVRAPAGVDLGSLPNDEIAVAVLAELVSLRAAGVFRAAGRRAVRAPVEAVDPVCGMTVDVGTAHHRYAYEGATYYFCAAGCQRQFEKSPVAFLGG
ncbi:MAG TPA: XdhC family protein [Mycobacteriales bacterium]|nr:XdhC family protein [Mycobacteriales bacterium]